MVAEERRSFLLADRVDAAIDAVGWTTGMLARRLGVSERSVYRWRTGQKDADPRVVEWLEVWRVFAESHELPEGWDKREEDDAMASRSAQADLR